MKTWTTALPVLAVIALIFTLGRQPPGIVVVIVALLLAGAVLAAVHHAEVIAHRVGEPFGSLVLAVAVTVIEVALIVSVMLSSGEKGAYLARDTVFAAVMITCNGIVGISLWVTAHRRNLAHFQPGGTGGMLAIVTALVTLTMVLPTFTTTAAGPRFTTAQLIFAAVVSCFLYGLHVFTQTVRHRDYFLPITKEGALLEDDSHADPPTNGETLYSLALLMVALVAVVGLAKVESPVIERGVQALGMPHAVVGVVIALLVLLPETIAAVRAARLGRTQTSLNLALGSANASIGLTIPVIALASFIVPGDLVLGLGPTQLVLLVLTVAVSTLTIVPGKASVLQGGVHLAVFASFLFLTVIP
ncbi:Ca2+:H+ antiporter [Actinocorallia herbida]|uniref:Ca2+:H+ antiporter n=1 Tax=Actinocorallia herbida TaxID=58109 RepID=A0A3N1CTI0_9ACTN|nr:ionic transporter y4hA [Actinocorallia herbida]ROO84610.1 Ca2+:H+ antiporter [Actinocorallia herbida]